MHTHTHSTHTYRGTGTHTHTHTLQAHTEIHAHTYTRMHTHIDTHTDINLSSPIQPSLMAVTLYKPSESPLILLGRELIISYLAFPWVLLSCRAYKIEGQIKRGTITV